MKSFKFTLRPKSAFGTPLAGDTLFGHLCWAVCERSGERGLTELLDGYTQGRPYLVISDGFPTGHLPRPTAPDNVLGLAVDPSQRKRAHTYRWLPADKANLPVQRWSGQFAALAAAEHSVVSQNTINRLTGTTGLDQFAPRQVKRTFFDDDARIDIYAVVDEQRFAPELLSRLLEDIGLHGYGRDATTGLGKFAVIAWDEQRWPRNSGQWWLTLAPCAPEPEALEAEGCFYLPLTRFGRHGNLAVVRGAPFKSPLLLAETGALLKSRARASWSFHGRGLGGAANQISQVLPGTVHQGYAPVVPLDMGGLA
jgi:CRISPR-associated protein Csm4